MREKMLGEKTKNVTNICKIVQEARMTFQANEDVIVEYDRKLILCLRLFVRL